MAPGSGRGFGRRSLLHGTAAGTAALALPALSCAASAQARSGRPSAEWGVQVGDVTTSSGLVWVRSDRPARMVVQTAATESFRNARTWHGPVIGAGTDFTGVTSLHGLPSGEQIHYRVLLADPDDPRHSGEPATGTFRTAPRQRRRDVRFLLVGGPGGPGLGDQSGPRRLPHLEEMRRRNPDFFLCSGDNIYADSPITCPRSRCRTAVSGETSRPRRSRRSPRRSRSSAARSATTCWTTTCAASTPRCPRSCSGTTTRCTTTGIRAQLLDDARYTEKDADVLAARSLRAFGEYFPVRTLRADGDGPGLPGGAARPAAGRVRAGHAAATATPIHPGGQTDDPQGILGADQLRWLKRELSRSQAVWKVDRLRHAAGPRRPGRQDELRGGRAGRSGRAAGPRAADGGAAAAHQAPAGDRHRVAHDRRPLHLGAALRAGAGGVQGLRAVLGVRLRAAERGRLPGTRSWTEPSGPLRRSSRRRTVPTPPPRRVRSTSARSTSTGAAGS